MDLWKISYFWILNLMKDFGSADSLSATRWAVVKAYHQIAKIANNEADSSSTSYGMGSNPGDDPAAKPRGGGN